MDGTNGVVTPAARSPAKIRNHLPNDPFFRFSA
jgi:hypothetical protein